MHYFIDSEYFENGVNGMSLERSKTDFSTGLKMNKDRFGIDDQIFEAIKNTIEWYVPQKLLVTDPLV